MTNPKCLGRDFRDTFSAKSAHFTGLKMRRITRGVSFDDLVGDLLKMQWHVNTKCLGGLDIDHQPELRGLLDRQVGGLLTLENPTGVGSIQTMRIRKTASVAYQATGLGVLAERKDRSHAVAGS